MGIKGPSVERAPAARRLAIVGLVIALIGADGASARAAPANLPVQTFHLPNGLTVLVVEDRRVPLVSVVSLHRFGAAQDPAGKPGLSHLVEHMLVQGYARPPRGTRSVANMPVKGTTGPDDTTYETECRKGEVGLALWHEAMRMTAFGRRADMERTFAAARDSARNEAQEGDDRELRSRLQVAAHELYPEGHPYRHVWDPQLPTLESATIDEMATFHRRYYRPENAIVAVVGDVDAGEVQELAQRYLGPLVGTGSGPATAPPPAPLAGLGRTIVEPGGDRRALLIYPVAGADDRDEPALRVLRALLGSGVGKLNQRLVRGRSLLRGLLVSHQPGQLGGWLTVELRPREGETLDHAIAGFAQELAALRNRWPQPDDLVPIKARLEFERVSNFQSYRDRAFALLWAYRVHGSARSLWAETARLNAVTAPQLRGVFARYLDRNRRLVLRFEPGVPRAAPARPAATSTATPSTAPPASPRITIPDPGAEGVLLSALNLPDPAVESFTLSNGLKVVLASVHDVPRVDGKLIVNAGDVSTAPERMGLARATAVLSTHGTRSRSLAVFNQDVARLGGSITSDSGLSAAEVSFQTLRSNLEQTLALWAEAVRAPSFEEGELELWKQRRLASRAADARDPEEASFDVLRSRLFPASSPWGWAAGGTITTVPRLRSADLQAFHRERYHPGNATLVVAGDIEAPALLPLLERELGDWPVGAAVPPPEAPPGNPAGAGEIVLVDVPGKAHASVQIATLGRADSSIDRAAGRLLADLLDMRIQRALRADGLAYQPRATFGAWTTASIFRISASVAPTRVGEVVRKIQSELKSLRDHAWRVESFQAAAIQGLFRHWQTLDGIEEALVIGSLFDLPTATLSTQAAAYDGADGASLQRLAVRMLAAERLVTVVAGDRRIIEPQLAAFGKVHVLPTAP
jgi:zinc protease